MSRADIIRRYLSERYAAQRFVPLALLLATAGMIALPRVDGIRTPGGLRSGLRAVFVGYLIVLALRIWDDLQDRHRDAHAHPDRITVRGDNLSAIGYLATLCATVAVLIITTGPQPVTRLLVFTLLGTMLGIWYRTRELVEPSPVISAHVVLIKYPVIAYIVAPGTANGASDILPGAPALIVLYLLLCIHEVLDDPQLRRSRPARGVLIAEFALVLPLVAFVAASMLELHLLFFRRGFLP